MSLLGLAAILALLCIIAASLWYLLITTEGVYLGRRVVIWLYDVYARRYDNIKKYDIEWEGLTLARPILAALEWVHYPLILDVATGTARLPLALLNQPGFDGHIIGLDYSRRMLAVAAENLRKAHYSVPARGHVELIHQHAQALPFDNNIFDAVTCLEALEFMPDPDAVIREIVRVTRPGGLIVLTNRKGVLMPGKIQPGEVFAARLQETFGLEDVIVSAWQVDYQLVFAYKPGELEPALGEGVEYRLETVLRCPRCANRTLIRVGGGVFLCAECESYTSSGADEVIQYKMTERDNTDNVSTPLNRRHSS